MRKIKESPEQLMQKLCDKLDRQYTQGVKVEMRLKGVYNLLLRVVDRMHPTNNPSS